jgi:hypothetical protein
MRSRNDDNSSADFAKSASRSRIIRCIVRSSYVIHLRNYIPCLSWLLATPLFLQKASPAWLPQVADHLVPNQGLGFFEFFRERERGKLFFFKGLQKPLSAQIQGN